MNVAAALMLVGLGQGLLLVGLLTLRRDLRTASTLLLAGLISAVVASGLEDAALQFGWLDAFPVLAGLTLPLLPLIGLCLRGHVEAVLERDWRPGRRHAPWLALAGLGEICAAVFLGHPAAIRLDVLSDRITGGDGLPVAAFMSLITVHFLSAAIIAAALLAGLRDVRLRTKTTPPASPLASRLVWLRGVLALVGLSWVAYTVSLAAGLVPGLPADEFQAVAGIVQVVSLYALGLLGLVRPDRMLPPPREILAAVIAPVSEKYGRSALAPSERVRIAAELDRLMTEHHLYRDPLLSLPRLAGAMGVSANDLSQTINTELGLSYPDYIARLRVAAARTLLEDPACGGTVTEILLEVGFNSRSVFNAAFKRQTGMTPSDCRRQAQEKARRLSA